MLPAELCDPVDQFAVEALRVETSFARNDRIGGGNLRLKVHPPSEQLPAGNQLSAVTGMQGGSHAAGRSAARKQRVQSDPRGKGLHPALQPLEHRRIGPLLRAEDHRGTVNSQQRVAHVAGHLDFNLSADMFIDPGEVPVGHVASRFAAEHARPAVVGGAAADSQHDPPHPQFHGLADQYPQPEGGGLLGVAELHLHLGESAHLRHLDEGGVAAQQNRRAARAHQRVKSLDFNAFRVGSATGKRAFEDGQRTVAPVGQRQLYDLQMLRLALHTVAQDGRFQGVGHLQGGSGSFEFVGGYEDAPFHEHKVTKKSRLRKTIKKHNFANSIEVLKK